MLDAIKSIVAELASGDERRTGFDDDDYRVAMAALLVHAAAIDGNVSDVERQRLVALLRERFELDAAAAGELVEAGTAAEHEAVDLYRFTRLLDRTLDDAQRARVVEMLWEVVYVDGRAGEFENNLIWRIADLLHVPSRDRIALRRQVAQRRAGGRG